MPPTIDKATLLPYLERYFGQLNKTSFSSLIDKMEWIELLSGSILMKEGDQAEGMYILLAGRLRVYLEDGKGQKKVIGSILRGESVGEMGLITEEPRTATVAASRDSILVKICKEDFDELCAKHPAILREFSKTVISWLNQANRKSYGVLRPNIALVPLNPIEGMAKFIDRLIVRISPICPAQHFHVERVEQEVGHPIESFEQNDIKLSINRWVAELDTKDVFTIYEARNSMSFWTRKSVRQADTVYLLVDADNKQIDRDLLAFLKERRERHKEVNYVLLLVHPSDKELPSGTLSWLNKIAPDRHHHIRLDSSADIRRLVRFMTGQAIGMAFGGGGARGMAHIGVHKAFKELGIEIDMIGGTSIGAIVGASVAMDWSMERMLETAANAFLKGKISKDVHIPFFSFLKGNNKEKVLREFFDYQIEDLWYNFLCVSCNLSLMNLKVHERGSLWQAISASSAIPGVFPPQIQDGHFLIDGALNNNIPGDILKENGAAYLVTSDLGGDDDLLAETDHFPSNKAFIRQRFFRKKKHPNLPSIVQIYIRSSFLASANHARQINQMADIALQLPLQEIGFMDWEKMDSAIRIGYQQTMQYFEENENVLSHLL
ncbi:MAG: patatin-like phospholipase family protein [Bacteroidota bacterium]